MFLLTFINPPSHEAGEMFSSIFRASIFISTGQPSIIDIPERDHVVFPEKDSVQGSSDS